MKHLVLILFSALTASAQIYIFPPPTGSGGSGESLPSQAGNGGKFLTTDGTNAAWAAVLASPYALDITAGETVNLDHNYGTKDAKVVCVAAASPYAEVFPGAVEYPSTNRITLIFSPAFTGRCAVFSSIAGAGAGGGGGSGTVTSVGLTAPSEISVSGSPVTASGSFTLAWASQTANKFLASPDGSSGAMSARAIVNGDLPIVSIAKGGTGGQTASAARVALLPSLSGNASKCMAVNSGATDVEWTTCASGGGGGTVDGTSLLGAGTAGDPLRVNPATVPTRITGTASLSMSTFGSSNCEEGSITVSGAAVGDEVMIGAPTGLGMGLVWSGYVSSASTVTLRVCRITGSATISAQTFRATIIRSF